MRNMRSELGNQNWETLVELSNQKWNHYMVNNEKIRKIFTH